MRTTITYAAKLALITTLFGLWLFAGVGRSYACSCVEPDPPAEALANSTVVFAGRVVAIRGFDIPESGIVSSADLGTIELKVSTVWKGPVQETMFVTTVRDEAGCGFTFAEACLIAHRGDEHRLLYGAFPYGADLELDRAQVGSGDDARLWNVEAAYGDDPSGEDYRRSFERLGRRVGLHARAGVALSHAGEEPEAEEGGGQGQSR